MHMLQTPILDRQSWSPPESRRSGVDFNSHNFQMKLSEFNHRRLAPSLPNGDWAQNLSRDLALSLKEGEFVEHRRREFPWADRLPPDAEGFLKWFERLEKTGPGQHDPLFDWLAESASREQMRWFLKQEVAGEAGFDDLVALTQVKIPTRAKLEMGRNYWDELGRGHEKGMHGPMLGRLAEEMGVAQSPMTEIIPESLALSNLLTAFAANRRYAYHSIGALGAVELTAPARARKVYEGLKRLGYGGDVTQYYLLHSTLDVKHSEAWNQEVLLPLATERPDLIRPIAEGAWLRLDAGAQCFARYRQEFRLVGTH